MVQHVASYYYVQAAAIPRIGYNVIIIYLGLSIYIHCGLRLSTVGSIIWAS